MNQRRSLLLAGTAVALTGAALTGAAPAAAQPAWPTRPVRLVVPFPPGGGVDTYARVLAAKLSERWGQPVVADNRPGANTIIGTEAVQKAAPDGYTLLITISGFAVNPSLYKKLTYDPVKDFTPITQLSVIPLLLVVNPKVPAANMAEFIALARSQPGKLNYASIGIGSNAHLGAELFKQKAGIELTHVSYKGAAPAITDLLAGEVQMMLLDNLAAAPYVQSGQLKALGITSAQRSPLAPAVPPIADTVPGFSVVGWMGLLAPAGTPPEIAERIQGDVRAVLGMSDIADKLATMGPAPASSTPAQFAAFIQDEVRRWSKVVADLHVRIDE